MNPAAPETLPPSPPGAEPAPGHLGDAESGRRATYNYLPSPDQAPPLDNSSDPPSDPPEQFKYWAFISYSHRDSAVSKWLHSKLENYSLPPGLHRTKNKWRHQIPERIFPCFRDRDELAGSSDVSSDVMEALRLSRFLVVICSPEAAKSTWVNEEIKIFKAMGRGDRVLALIARGTPLAKRPKQECFPPALRFHVDRDGNPTERTSEPCAADVRFRKDGRRNAVLKIVAGIIGVEFNALRQRERDAETLKETLSIIFRWIAFLPAAALAQLAVNIIVPILWKLSAINIGYLQLVFISGLGGYFFVAAGYSVVPAAKKSIAIALCALQLVACGFFLAIGIMADYQDIPMYVRNIFAAIGSVICMAGLLKDEILW